MTKVKITVNGILIEDLQKAQDIHLEGRTHHYLKKANLFTGGETRGRKGTGKARVFSRQVVDLGDDFQNVEIELDIVEGRISHLIKVVDK